MSEHMFGYAMGHVTRKEEDRRDAICIEEGGYGFTQINDPGHGWKGWFTGPNLGAPFDGALASRVLARI